MTVALQTGAKCNVSSASDAELYAGIYGRGSYVMGDAPALELSDANTLSIGPCNIIQNGRHIRLRETSQAMVPSGVQGAKRASIVVVRTTLDYDSDTLEPIEKSELVTVTGDSVTEGDPQDPAWVEGDLLAGDTVADFPIARVVTDGLNVGQPVSLVVTARSLADHGHDASDIEGGVLPIERGGTGNATGNAASATKLATARTLRTNLASTSTVSFNGTANVTPGVTGTLPIANGGTGATSAASALSALGAAAASTVNRILTPTHISSTTSAAMVSTGVLYTKYKLYLLMVRNDANMTWWCGDLFTQATVKEGSCIASRSDGAYEAYAGVKVVDNYLAINLQNSFNFSSLRAILYGLG